MIGQAGNLSTIKAWRKSRNIPRFTLIVGDGERLELAQALGSALNATCIIVGKGIEDIRSAIDSAYKVNETTLYIIENGDALSNAAINATLKVTEEPPNNAYFAVLFESNVNILPTLKNRATPLIMQPYSISEIEPLVHNNIEMAVYCRTPQQAREWADKPKEFGAFVSWCSSIAKKLQTMSGVESFRIAEKLALTNDTGYDPIQFIRIVSNKLMGGANCLTHKQALEVYDISTNTINDLKRVGLRKDMTVDAWILSIRKVIKDG